MRFSIYLFIALLSFSSVCAAQTATYYHATDYRNLQSILRDGLVTSQGGNNQRGLSHGNEECECNCKKKIHLTVSQKLVLAYAKLIVDNFRLVGVGNGNPVVILQITLDASLTTKDPDDDEAVTVSNDIPPSQIKIAALVVKDGSKYFVLKG